MTVAWALILAASLLLVVCGLGVVARISQQRRRIAGSLRKLDWRKREQQLLENVRREAQMTQKQIEGVIDQGSYSVESIHRSIADLSFELFGGSDRPLYDLHTHTVDHVYDRVRKTNKLAGRLFSRLIDVEDESDD